MKCKIFGYLCLFFVGLNLYPLSLTSRETSKSRAMTIPEAYVTFATENYFPLLEVLLDSVKAFSTRPIVVFGVNADVPFSQKKYPFMIKRRIDIPSSSKESVFFAKPRVFLESRISHGVYLDADIILNEGCDILFTHCQKITDYPLCPVFPWEVNNQQAVMEAMGVANKSMQYVHAPLIIFSGKCLPFLRQWRKYNISYGALAPCHDETILNVLLWKYKAKTSINLCDPYYALAYDYLRGGVEQHQLHGYKDWVGKIDFYTFHGCKSAGEARNILALLIEKKQSGEAGKACKNRKARKKIKSASARMVKGSEEIPRYIQQICR